MKISICLSRQYVGTLSHCLTWCFAAGSDSDSDPGVIDPHVRRSTGYGSEGEGTDDERDHPG